MDSDWWEEQWEEKKTKTQTCKTNNALSFAKEQNNVNTASREALYITITLITKHLYCGRTPNYIYSGKKDGILMA